MLKQYFLSNLIVVILLNLLVKPVWVFLIDRNVQLTVGHHEYGLYSALLNMTLIFSIILDWGITNYNNRNISGDTQRIHFALPNMIVAKLIMSFVYGAVICMVALLLGYTGRAIVLLLLAGSIQFMNSFLQYLRSNVSAHHDFKIDSVLSVMDKLIMIAVIGLLLLNPVYKAGFQIEWYLYAQIGAYFMSIVLAVWIIVKRYARINFQHVSGKEMKRLISSSLPYALLILLMGIYMRSDALMLERLDSAVSSSIYAEAYRILDALNMFGFLVAGILLPMFTRLLSKGLPVQQIVQISTNIMVSIGLCIVAHSLFYRNEIMLLLDKHADPTLPTVYAAVILTFPAYCLMYIFSTLLTASGHIQLLVKIALLGCVLSIGLNLFFIPRYHALGAGYTAIVVQYAVAFLSVYFCTIKFKTSQVSAWGYKFVLLTILLLLVNYLFYTFKVPLLWSVLLNIPFFFIAVYVIKLWDMANLLRLIRQYSSPDSR